jgi:sugar phosphate isomerase/epimerase
MSKVPSSSNPATAADSLGDPPSDPTLSSVAKPAPSPVRFSRRNLLARAGTTAAVGMTAAMSTMMTIEPAHAADPPQRSHSFHFGLNTSTLRGQKLPLAELVDIAAQAGYQAIEPWISELEDHVHRGGSLADLGKRIRDLGMQVVSAIAFAEWIVDDDARRAKGLEQARHDMDLVHQVGGLRIAAPPAGAQSAKLADLGRVAERYRALLHIGDQIGIVPELEFWGFSKTLSRLSEAVEVVLDVGHPKACVLPDIYHMYKGGSSFEGLRLLSGNAMHVIHLNDYPAQPPRETITDAARVFPGDGVAPLATIFRDLRDGGFDGTLSIELFNPHYWAEDPRTVARTALAKSRAIVADALG